MTNTTSPSSQHISLYDLKVRKGSSRIFDQVLPNRYRRKEPSPFAAALRTSKEGDVFKLPLPPDAPYKAQRRLMQTAGSSARQTKRRVQTRLHGGFLYVRVVEVLPGAKVG